MFEPERLGRIRPDRDFARGRRLPIAQAVLVH
jgi:hypothetical protein